MNTATTWLLSALVALAALHTGCSDEDLRGEELVCPDDDTELRVVGEATFTPPQSPLGVDDTITITGSAAHLDELAIRTVEVAGITAELLEFNFQRWSATLGYNDLVLAAVGDGTAGKVIQAFATDACGNRYAFDAFEIPLDPTPKVDIDQLSIEVAYPNAGSFVPTNGARAAEITVTATGRAADAGVALTSGSGRFQGGGSALTLRSNGDGTASAGATFVADQSGDVLITALSDGVVATQIVRAAADPSISPGAATLVPGGEMQLRVLTEGELDTCTANTLSTDFTVTHQGTPLTFGAVTMQRNVDDEYIIRLATKAAAADDAQIFISCRDAFGQADTAQFDLVVANPPPTVVVDTLEIDIEIPQGRTYLPADGSAFATVIVTGTGMADEAMVALDATSGSFQGASGGVVELNGGTTATGRAFFFPDTRGTVVITAIHGSATAIETIQVVGPPQIAPAGATLFAGADLGVNVVSEGVIATCQATPSADIEVTHDAGLIGAGPTQVFPDAQGRVVVTVSALFGAAAGASITLTCSDQYRQFAAATFTVAVP